jgi:predicted membrane channel-forming protein YqfA (hemolysin III family)
MSALSTFPSHAEPLIDLIRNQVPVLLDVFNPRDRFSAWSHGAAAIAAVPATVLLWRSAGVDRFRRICLAVYGFSMIVCYTASTLFHSVCGLPGRILAFDRIDHIGIYLWWQEA